MAKVGSQITLAEPPKPLVLPTEVAVLVNITTVKLPVYQLTYGNYTLPYCRAGFQSMREIGGTLEAWKCEPGQEWAAIKIPAARGIIDRGPNPKQDRMEFVIHAREIALDLCRQCNSDIWGIGHTITGVNAGEVADHQELIAEFSDGEGAETVRGFAGVFLADGDRPTEAELIEMRELLRLSDAALVEEGHKTWDQFKKPDFIHEGFKRAARRIGVEADWLYTIYNTALCPHCGAKLLSLKATVCATCGRDVVPQSAANGQERPEAHAKSASAGKGKRSQKVA